MKTNRPDSFSCKTYLQSWELGFRDGTTRRHIESCFFCRPLVLGGTEEFPLSVEEEVSLNLEQKKLASRRRFLRQAGVAAGLVGLSALGLNVFKTSESVGTTNAVDSEITAEFAVLDGIYSTSGRAGIESRLQLPNATRKSRALQWIQKRHHPELFDLICIALCDPRSRISMGAFQLLQQIDPVVLKPHHNLLIENLEYVRNPELRDAAHRLAIEIESS